MNPEPSPPVILPISITAPVVRQFDVQLLESVEDASLSAAQQDELLAWAHSHLLSVYVARHLDAFPDPAAEPADRRLIEPCTSVVERIDNMLQGRVPVGADLAFHCPPVCCERAHALHGRLPAWVRRRVELAAQRTRWHTDAELVLLWEAVEAHLLTGAIAGLDWAELLDGDVPTVETLEATTRGCLEAMYRLRGLAWTPHGTV